MEQDSNSAGAAQSQAGVGGVGQGRVVLVVEDESNISEAIRYILNRDGWRVTVLDSGAQLEQTLVTQTPALMILDVMLPGQSGFDILRNLRSDPQMLDLPVILLTAKGQAGARELAMECGASLFMAKPFANRDLLDAVRDLVRG